MCSVPLLSCLSPGQHHCQHHQEQVNPYRDSLVPEAVPGSLPVVTCAVFVATLCGSYYYYPHFKVEETEAGSSRVWPQACAFTDSCKQYTDNQKVCLSVSGHGEGHAAHEPGRPKLGTGRSPAGPLRPLYPEAQGSFLPRGGCRDSVRCWKMPDPLSTAWSSPGPCGSWGGGRHRPVPGSARALACTRQGWSSCQGQDSQQRCLVAPGGCM